MEFSFSIKNFDVTWRRIVSILFKKCEDEGFKDGKINAEIGKINNIVFQKVSVEKKNKNIFKNLIIIISIIFIVIFFIPVFIISIAFNYKIDADRIIISADNLNVNGDLLASFEKDAIAI